MSNQSSRIYTLADNKITDIGSEASDVNNNLASMAMQFGDGVFESIFVYQKSAPLLERHLARLKKGMDVLDYRLPGSKIKEQALVLIKQLPDSHFGYRLKILLYRESAIAGYSTQASKERLVLLAMPYQIHDHNNITALICKHRLSKQPELAGIKHNNRLDQILARREVDASPFDEGLLCDQDNYLTEAISSNIFLVKGNNLVTPALTDCGVNGVMREWMIERLEQKVGVLIEEKKIVLDELSDCDSVIVTNAINGVRILEKCKMPDESIITWRTSAKALLVQQAVSNFMLSKLNG